MRTRVEDLGRILVLLDKALDNHIFTLSEWHRELLLEDMPHLDVELKKFCNELEILRDALVECHEICEGEDPLNRYREE